MFDDPNAQQPQGGFFNRLNDRVDLFSAGLGMMGSNAPDAFGQVAQGLMMGRQARIDQLTQEAKRNAMAQESKLANDRMAMQREQLDFQKDKWAAEQEGSPKPYVTAGGRMFRVDETGMPVEEMFAKPTAKSERETWRPATEEERKAMNVGQGYSMQVNQYGEAHITKSSAATQGGTEAGSGISKEQAKATDEINKEHTARYADLNKNRTIRRSNIEEAKRFKALIESGDMTTGAWQSAKQWIPGTFTDESVWHEQFDALSEQAARSFLKASGETKMTDADVDRTKKSMFNVGQDEDTNIAKLDKYIREQEAEEQEFLEMHNYATQVGNFSGYSERKRVGEMSDEELFK